MENILKNGIFKPPEGFLRGTGCRLLKYGTFLYKTGRLANPNIARLTKPNYNNNNIINTVPLHKLGTSVEFLKPICPITPSIGNFWYSSYINHNHTNRGSEVK